MKNQLSEIMFTIHRYGMEVAHLYTAGLGYYLVVGLDCFAKICAHNIKL
jgi:hypothetical protein